MRHVMVLIPDHCLLFTLPSWLFIDVRNHADWTNQKIVMRRGHRTTLGDNL